MLKTQFNTGRPYTAKGQRIVAMAVHDGMGERRRKGIIFSDLDRGIDGFIPLVKLPEDRIALQDQTLHNYDYGNYRYDPAVNSGLPDQVEARELTWEN